MRLAILWLALLPTAGAAQAERGPGWPAGEPAAGPAPAVVPVPRETAREAVPGTGWLASLHAGVFQPTGPSLDGFGTGRTLALSVGYAAERGAGFEVWLVRSTTQASDGVAAIDLAQSGVVGSLRLCGPAGTVEACGSAGLGWFTTSVDAAAGSRHASSEDGRLGFLLTAGVAVPLAPRAALMLEGMYGGAYATLFDSPTWIAGWSAAAGVRFTIPP